MEKIRTLGQKRAEYALGKVLEIPKEIKKDFKSFSAGAPTMILQNGFGQAIAFWLSKVKGEDKHKFIVDTIREWLDKNELIKAGVSNNKDFVTAITNLSQEDYLAAQKETLSLLEWVKRYASAFCKDDEHEAK